MKLIFIFFSLLLAVNLYSQSSSNTTSKGTKADLGKYGKKLVGSWKCDGIEIINQVEYMNQTLETTPDSLKERVSKHFEEVFRMMADTMNFCTLIFNDDKSMESIFHYKRSKGKWHMSSDGKELSTREDGTVKDIKYKVIKLKKKKIIISDEDKEIKVKIGFLRIN